MGAVGATESVGGGGVQGVFDVLKIVWRNDDVGVQNNEVFSGASFRAALFSAASRFCLALFSACMASKGPMMAEIIIRIQYQGILFPPPAGESAVSAGRIPFDYPMVYCSISRFPLSTAGSASCSDAF